MHFTLVDFCLFFIFRSRQAGIVSTVLSAVSLTPAKNLPAVSLTLAIDFIAGVVVKGVIDTSEKFIPGVVVTSDHCSAVSLIPAINSSSV